MTADPDCWACRAEIRHDERPEAQCVHGGRDCCRAALRARVRLREALWRSEHGDDVEDQAAAVHVPASPRALTDPVGAVWFEDLADDDVDDDDG